MVKLLVCFIYWQTDGMGMNVSRTWSWQRDMLHRWQDTRVYNKKKNKLKDDRCIPRNHNFYEFIWAFCLKGSAKMNSTALSPTCTSSIKWCCVALPSLFSPNISNPGETLDQLWIWRGLRSLPLISLISQNGGEEIPLSVVSEVLSPQGRDPDTQRQFSLLPRSSDQGTVTQLATPYCSP